MANTNIIALTGKGGVGKTTLSAAFVRVLHEKHPEAKILTIDADPAVGLSTALGITVKQTLDDIRRDIIEHAENGSNREAIELLSEARYRIFDALVETEGFSFMAIGRPEGAGCYCAINSYLKAVIDMVSQNYDYVVIDGEAGIEQINRRVMEKVTHLFFITDASKKGRDVATSIKSVADELVMYEKCGTIINRVDDEALIPYIQVADTPILAVIKSDSDHAKNDVMGKTVFELPEDSEVLKGTWTAIEKMGL